MNVDLATGVTDTASILEGVWPRGLGTLRLEG